MFSRKTLGIAGAAILGTLVGTNAAHAQIAVDAMGNVTGQVKYAKETLTVNATTPSGGTTYYNVSGAGNILDVTIPLGFEATNQGIIVSYTLGGMVFGTAIASANLVLQDTSSSNAALGTPNKVNGGAAADSSVRFIVSGASAAADDTLKLTLTGLAVDSGGTGSITMRAAYTVSGETVENTVTISDAVKAVNALKETVTAASSTPVALVDEGFMKFGPPGNASSDGLKAAVGKITIGLEAADIRVASDGTVLTVDNMVAEMLGGAAGGADLNFTGDLGFVDDVSLYTESSTASCDTSVIRLDMEDDDGVHSWKPDAADLSHVDATGAHLCVTVDGETVIPETSYAVTITYGNLANSAFPPAASTKTVGGIKRDGTTVHIPFLTTHPAYNQRIVILNRNSTEVGYTITFTPEAGVTATAGADAEGMLAPNSRTVLSLRNDEVVSFAEGDTPRTAATIEVVSIPGNIGVSSVLKNPDGNLDTVVYQD